MGPLAPPPPPGTWVVFRQDAFVPPHHVVVRGMLGVVDADGYACTPGVSTMVLPLGAEEPYGFWNASFVALDAPPDDGDLAASRALRRDALSVYESRHGFTGWVELPGGRRVQAEQAVKEVGQLADRLAGWDREGRGGDREARGTGRRLGRVLRALSRHPLGAEAAGWAEALEADACAGVARSVRAWAAEASGAPTRSGGPAAGGGGARALGGL